MTGATKRAEGAVIQDVWVGDVEALEKLVARIREIADYIHEKLDAVADAGKDAREQEFHESNSRIHDPEVLAARWEDRESRLYGDIATETSLHMQVEEERWSMTSTGTPEAVIPEIEDVTDVKKVTIGLGGRSYADRGGYNLNVVLSSTGASAYFVGPESRFIDFAKTRIAGEFRRHRPWYWWFRARWTAGALSIPAGVAAIFVSNAVLRATNSVALALTFQLGFMAIVVLGGVFLMRRVAVPFELLRPGAKGRAGRNLGRIAAFGGWILTTILVPLILPLFTSGSG